MPQDHADYAGNFVRVLVFGPVVIVWWLFALAVIVKIGQWMNKRDSD